MFTLFLFCISFFLQWDIQTAPTRYRTCDIGFRQSDSKPSNWLISGQIEVNEANRIDVTVEYYIRSCSNLPNNGGPYCVNVFDLYVNQSDQFIEYQSLYPNPLSNSMAYEKAAEIKQATDVRTFETIIIRVKGKHAILAFHNYGACSILFSVKVTYNVCPDETLNSSLVSLPRTVAPVNDSQPFRVKVKCDKDTVQVSGSLYVVCEINGEWNTTGLEGRCICKEDMQNNGGICQGMLYFACISAVRYFSVRKELNTKVEHVYKQRIRRPNKFSANFLLHIRSPHSEGKTSLASKNCTARLK